MDKATVLTGATGVSVELGSWYDWIDIGVSPEGKLLASIKPNDGERKDARISPKKVRKIAKALLALADEVDPPAPKFEYYRSASSAAIGGAFIYRQRGGTLELWNDDGSWTSSGYGTIEQRRRFQPDTWPVTADELPKEAR